MTFWLFMFIKWKLESKLCTHVYIVLYFKFRYVSCVLGCPYEGSITPQKVTEVGYASFYVSLQNDAYYF